MAEHAAVKNPNDLIEEWHGYEKGLKKFNRRVGMNATNLLGSMAFFWFCVCLDVIAFVGLIITTITLLASQTSPLTLGSFVIPSIILKVAGLAVAWAAFASQTVIQLLALPLLQYSGNVVQEQQQAKAETDHKTLTYLATLQDEQMQELKLQTKILEKLNKNAKV